MASPTECVTIGIAQVIGKSEEVRSSVHFSTKNVIIKVYIIIALWRDR